MRVEPVAETIGTRFEATSASPIAGPPMTICARPSGASGPKRLSARSRIFIVASAESGVFSDGFQITGSPQTSASAAFHDQTATGKLKAEMIAHGPMRMPGLGHPVAGALGGDDEAVQLPRQADGEIADVDHLLHFAEALGDDLADLERDQRAERLLRGAQFLAKQAHELAPPGAGISRQARKALWARSMIAGMSAAGVSRTRAISAPSIGERTESEPPLSSAAVKPKRSRMSSLVMVCLILIACPLRAARPVVAKPLFDPKSARPASPVSPGGRRPRDN